MRKQRRDRVKTRTISREQLREARDYAEAIVQTVREPLVVLDADLRVQTANRSFYQTFQVLPEETEQQFLYELGNGQWNIPKLRVLLEEILPQSTEFWDFEVDHAFAHIGHKTMRLNARRIRGADDRTQRILLAIEDITERKRAEEERARLLIDEQAAREKAEAATRAKDEFVAMVSHELRTPLISMLGWARLLRSGTLDAADSARALETIERNAQSQEQLINDLLDVSRIITGKLRLDARPVELAPVIKAAIDIVRLAADAKGIAIEFVLDPRIGLISGDADRLQQVFWNLLSNAIKFTPQGGRVAVRLLRADLYAQITVTDSGQGIRADLRPYVFDRFRQADASSTRTQGGLGLGLAIVRHLVELHGGTVHAESPGEGLGATFTVKLPLAAARRAVKGSEGMRPTVGSRMLLDDPPSLDGVRVLVVDDEADAREFITRVLEQCRARIMTVASVGEALDVLQLRRPDVLVSDIGMPGEDGYALIRQVRALEAEHGGQVPAVALTAGAGSEDRTRALAAGYQMHVPKPVEPAELAAVVAGLAGRAKKA